jgi:hypothetical protein
MSRYGLTRYNLGYYGSSDANPFIATNFTATEKGYGHIYLEWNSPYGQWSKIKLVRNSYGFPVNAYDGMALDIKNDNSYVAFKETDPTSYDDTSTLGDNAFYYYSLFVFEIHPIPYPPDKSYILYFLFILLMFSLCKHP